jgi:hypothetical protein
MIWQRWPGELEKSFAPIGAEAWLVYIEIQNPTRSTELTSAPGSEKRSFDL